MPSQQAKYYALPLFSYRAFSISLVYFKIIKSLKESALKPFSRLRKLVVRAKRL